MLIILRYIRLKRSRSEAAMADYYEILGINPGAEEKEIRGAYRKLAKQYHPDAGEGSSAEAFRSVQEAYDILSDPERRREYDKRLYSDSQASPDSHIPRYSHPAAHLDIRDVINSRNKSARPGEMRRTCYSVVGLDDQWEDLRDLFKRELEK